MKTQDKFNELTAKLIATIENGETGEWLKPFKSGGLPKNYSTQKPYRGANVLFLWMMAQERGYKTNQWLTFNQVSAMGGHVLKGELATPVFFFKFMDVKEEDEMGEMTQKYIPLFKTYNVFNVDQTSLELSTDKENTTIPEIEEFIAATGASIAPAQSAFFSPEMDAIGMPDMSLFASEAYYYSVLLHELSHWSGYETRLNRANHIKKYDDVYAFEELIAELSSAFLCAKNSISMDNTAHAEYMSHWVKMLKEKPYILFSVSTHASKSAAYISHLANKNTQEQKEDKKLNRFKHHAPKVA